MKSVDLSICQLELLFINWENMTNEGQNPLYYDPRNDVDHMASSFNELID